MAADGHDEVTQLSSLPLLVQFLQEGAGKIRELHVEGVCISLHGCVEVKRSKKKAGQVSVAQNHLYFNSMFVLEGSKSNATCKLQNANNRIIVHSQERKINKCHCLDKLCIINVCKVMSIYHLVI